MMRMRTVVSFEPSVDGATSFKLEVAPSVIAGLGVHAPADVTDPGGTIVNRGTALVARLMDHKPVGDGLAEALKLPANAPEPAPLYFHMIAASADQLPWEQLYDAEHEFYALDRRWPIGRIAGIWQRVTDRAFVPPLKIVAVLSAAQRSGLPQLRTLLTALRSVDAQKIGVHLHVISAEKAVLKAVKAARRPNATCEMIGGTKPDLTQSITAANPDILHLLCHGGADTGERTLAFANLGDITRKEKTGSLLVKVKELTPALAPCNPWLVVLSACQTAAGGEAPALAHEIASDGAPAVVGMRRLIDVGAADMFCAALYPQVLSVVRAAIEPGGLFGIREIDWVTALTAPRNALAGPDPAARDVWSDPVLYIQSDPLRVFRSTPKLSATEFAELRSQLDVLEDFRARQDPAVVDPRVLAYIEARIAELRRELAEGGGV